MQIKELLRDKRALTDGVTVAPMGDDEELRVTARGFTQRYRQRIDTTTKKLSRQYGKLEKIPADLYQTTLAGILMEELIIDVTGLRDGDRDLPLAEVRVLAESPEGEPLYQTLLMAVQMVDSRREADAEEAGKN